MSSDLQNPIFTDENKARAALEATRWPDGPFCPHCGVSEHIAKLEGKSHSRNLPKPQNTAGQRTKPQRDTLKI